MKVIGVLIVLLLLCVWLPWNIAQVDKGVADCEKKGDVLYHARGESTICIDKKSVIK